MRDSVFSEQAMWNETALVQIADAAGQPQPKSRINMQDPRILFGLMRGKVVDTECRASRCRRLSSVTRHMAEVQYRQEALASLECQQLDLVLIYLPKLDCRNDAHSRELPEGIWLVTEC